MFSESRKNEYNIKHPYFPWKCSFITNVKLGARNVWLGSQNHVYFRQLSWMTPGNFERNFESSIANGWDTQTIYNGEVPDIPVILHLLLSFLAGYNIYTQNNSFGYVHF